MYREHLEDRKLSLELFAYIWIMYAVVYMTKNCYSAAMASIVHEGIMTKSQTGFIMAVFYLVYAPLQIVGGRFADRENPERLITIGLLGSALANLVIFFNQNYYVMLVAWTFNAVVQYGVWPSVFKIISSQLKESHRKKGAFFISFASSCGLLMAYAVAMFVTQWQYNFLISAILLFVCAIVLYIIYPHIEKHMVKDQVPVETLDAMAEENVDTKDEKKPHAHGTGDIFLKSGFYFMIPVFVISFLNGNVVKTLSPTMLMESYETISPAIGNFLNLFIILAGIGGTVAVKFFLYPKYVKEELKGIFLLLFLVLPLLAVMLFVGKAPVVLMVVSMALVAMLASAMALLQTFVSMRFKKFGKEGEAAGIANAGSSLGIVLQSYGITYVADALGWQAVTWLLLGLTVAAIVIVAVVLPKWLKFARAHEI